MKFIPHNARILLPYLSEHKNQLIIASLLTILKAFIQLPGPLIIKRFLDFSIHQKEIREFLFIAALMISITLAAHLIDFYSHLFFTKANKTINLSIRKGLLNRILHAKYLEITKHDWGYYMSRIEDDSTAIQSFFVDTFISMAITIFALVVSLVTIFYLSNYLGLSFLPVICVTVWLTFKQKKTITRELAVYRDKEAKKAEELGESLHLMPFTKIASNSSYSYSKYVVSLQDSIQSYINYVYVYLKTSVRTGIITEGGESLLIFGLGGHLVLKGYTTIGTVIAINSYSSGIISNVNNLISQYYELQKASISFDRIGEIMSLPQEIPNFELSHNLTITSIRLEQVTVKYGDKTILKDFSMEAKCGDKILVTGPSGIGKSTLLKTIIGIIPLENGKIYINGTEVDSQDLCNYRLKMGFVDQEPVLSNDTISNNITIIYPEATKAEIISAANKAYVSEFVNDQLGGFEANIGPSGNKLSIGQKQRIAISRALIRKPNLLLMDEPLSNVDPVSEKCILETIKKLPSDVIVIMISHKTVPDGIFTHSILL